MRTKTFWRILQPVWLCIVILATGCRSLPRCPETIGPKLSSSALDALAPEHVIELNADGLLYDLRPNQHHHLLKTEADVTNYLAVTLGAGFNQSGLTQMMVFVHGGMNSHDMGYQHFRDDYQSVLATNYYPVFVVWPSGWPGTYKEHLFWMRQGVRMETTTEKAFGLATSPFVLLIYLGRALARLP